MSGVVLLVDFQVHDPEGFAEAVQRLTQISLAEPGTLRYEWFVSDDGTAARIIEEFADEAALAEHSADIARRGGATVGSLTDRTHRRARRGKR